MMLGRLGILNAFSTNNIFNILWVDQGVIPSKVKEDLYLERQSREVNKECISGRHSGMFKSPEDRRTWAGAGPGSRGKV